METIKGNLGLEMVPSKNDHLLYYVTKLKIENYLTVLVVQKPLTTKYIQMTDLKLSQAI